MRISAYCDPHVHRIMALRHFRKHWKKYAFGTLALYLGSRYFTKKFRERVLIRRYCHRAKVHGEQTVGSHGLRELKKVVVFLNPAANKREAKIQFLKYAAPLLHLSGMDVTVVESEYEGQIRTLLNYIDPTTDGIIVAGGDGTLLEVVNGLMRRFDAEKTRTIPIGVIPLGRENRFYKKKLLPPDLHDSPKPARLIGEATMDIIEGSTVPVHLIEMQPEIGRKLYTVSSMEWGAFKDAYEKRNSFRLFGKLRLFFSHLNTALRKWPDDYTLHYWLPAAAVSMDSNGTVPPGSGTKSGTQTGPESTGSHNQRHPPKDSPNTASLVPNFRYAHCISRSPVPDLHPKKKKTEEEEKADVTLQKEQPFRLTSLAKQDPDWKYRKLGVVGFKVSLVEQSSGPIRLHLLVWPSTTAKGRFINQGWTESFGKTSKAPLPSVLYSTSELLLQPHSHQLSWFSVDGESYEATPISMKLLPNAVHMYTRRAK